MNSVQRFCNIKTKILLKKYKFMEICFCFQQCQDIIIHVKTIHLVHAFFFIFTDIKNVSRKELSSAFQTAIKDLPNGNVKEAIEAQFEKYLGDFER